MNTFHAYCKNGEIENVRKFLAEHPEIPLNDGLLLACVNAHVDVASLLISRGANEFVKPLIHACYNGLTDIAELLLKHQPGWLSGTAAYHAARGGHMHIYYMTKPDRDAIGLYGACHGNQINVVRKFIDCTILDWDVALEKACIGGNVEIVKLILTRYAGDRDIGMCLNEACSHGNADAAELLINHFKIDMTQSYRAIIHGCSHADVIRMLFKYGAKSSPHLHLAYMNSKCYKAKKVLLESNITRVFMCVSDRDVAPLLKVGMLPAQFIAFLEVLPASTQNMLSTCIYILENIRLPRAILLECLEYL